MDKLLKKKGAIPMLGIIPVALVLIGLAVFAIMPKSSLISIDGDVEITTIPYFAKVSGEVESVLFEMGEVIPSGSVIATIDKQATQNQLDQLKETLLIKEAKLSQLVKGTNNAGIDAARKVAQSNITIYEEKVQMANKALENARKDLVLQQSLYEAEAISQVELELAERKVSDEESKADIAKSELNSARGNLDTITYPNQSGEVKAMEAEIRLTRLQIQQLQDTMEDYNVIAHEEGILIEKPIEKGSFVTTGQKVVELSKEGEKHFVFYLPEEYIDYVNYGDEIVVMPLSTKNKGEEYIGTVNYIDFKAVYTPKDAEGAANKNKRSMKVKAVLPTDTNLRAGQRARMQIDTKIPQ